MTQQLSSQPKRKAPRPINYEDVDDIIGIAAELSDIEQDRLSVEDLESIAQDLDIPASYLPAAIEELKRRRAALEAQAQAKAKKKRMLYLALGGLALVMVISGFVKHGSLKALHLEVEQTQAQVSKIIARKADTERIWGDAPDDNARRAELAGANNRVIVETKRYDEAVLAYRDALGPFGRLVASMSGLPREVPLSTERSF